MARNARPSMVLAARLTITDDLGTAAGSFVRRDVWRKRKISSRFRTLPEPIGFDADH
jgi:hypothetical protein